MFSFAIMKDIKETKPDVLFRTKPYTEAERKRMLAELYGSAKPINLTPPAPATTPLPAVGFCCSISAQILKNRI